MRIFPTVFLFLCSAALLPAAKDLEIYFVDVEGGQATLLVSPSKQPMLVDTGWPGLNMRDADRIAGAAKRAGGKPIDYPDGTHSQPEQVGSGAQPVHRSPGRTFLDHGAALGSDEDG